MMVALWLVKFLLLAAFPAPGKGTGGNRAVLVAPDGKRFRVCALSMTMVRVEAEGPKGFEDRSTFLVQNRSVAAAVSLRKESDSRAATDHYVVEVGRSDDSEAGPVAVFGKASGSSLLWQGWLSNLSATASMPQPAEPFEIWAMADRPRFAAPAAGAVPGSAEEFDLTNQADDAYFFVPETTAGSNSSLLHYTTLRKQLLQLTGPVPVLPDYAFGTMFTWYHNYTAAAKLNEIREFASRGIPLDVASLDMDWRLHPCYPNSLTPNCSDTPPETETQYVPNTELIPDVREFISAVHALNASLFFNDHPMQPDSSYTELSPKELQFRYDGLSSLLDVGLDFWWFDCHWHDLIPGIQCPGKSRDCANGVDYATWGQYVEWSVMAKIHANAGKRTMMLGCQNSKMHRASHRTPVWWTGDNMWDALSLGVQQTVDAGLDLKPYVHQDCGGHHGPGFGMTILPDGKPNPWGHLGKPTLYLAGDFVKYGRCDSQMLLCCHNGNGAGTLAYPGEVYARWLQYCSLGAVARIHSAPSLSRLPWKFGVEAEAVAKRFLLMRRSLAPMLTAAARQVNLDGTPLVRRCDLVWPTYAADGANSSTQYMLGDDLLVRPIDPFDGVPVDNPAYHTYKPVNGQYNRDASVWLPPGEWHDAFSGKVMAGGRTISLHNQSLERMPLFHRGGGMVITATADRNNASSNEWTDLKLHIWPSRAAFTPDGSHEIPADKKGTSAVAVDGDERLDLAAPQSRLLFATSDADPDATAPPLTKISKTEHRGRGFELSFEADEGSMVAEQRWTVRVHVPVTPVHANVAAAQLRCGESVIPLTEFAPTRLHSMPFSVAGHAPHQAPNSVMQGVVVILKSSPRRLTCAFGFHETSDESFP